MHKTKTFFYLLDILFFTSCLLLGVTSNAQVLSSPQTPISTTQLLVNKLEMSQRFDSPKDGLPINCYQSCIDHYGYVWIASAQGFFVYDGKRLQRMELPCNDYEVVCVLRDSNFVLGWTYAGEIFRIDIPSRKVSLLNSVLAQKERSGNFNKYMRIGDTAYFIKYGGNSLAYHIKDLFAPQFSSELNKVADSNKYPSRGEVDMRIILNRGLGIAESPYAAEINNNFERFSHYCYMNSRGYLSLGTRIYRTGPNGIEKIFSDPEGEAKGRYICSYSVKRGMLWISFSDHTIQVISLQPGYNLQMPQVKGPIHIGLRGWLMQDNAGTVILASLDEGLFKIMIANNGNIGYYDIKEQFKGASNNIHFLGMQQGNIYIGYDMPVVDVFAKGSRKKRVVGDTTNDHGYVKFYTENLKGDKAYMISTSEFYHYNNGQREKTGFKEFVNVKDAWVWHDSLYLKSKFEDYLKIDLKTNVGVSGRFKQRSNTFCYDSLLNKYYQGSLYGLYLDDVKVEGPLANERVLWVRNFGGDILVSTYKGLYVIPRGKDVKEAIKIETTDNELCLQLAWDGENEFYSLSKTCLKRIDRQGYNVQMFFDYQELGRQMFFNCFWLTEDYAFIGTTKGIVKVNLNYEYNKERQMPNIYLRNADSVGSDFLCKKTTFEYSKSSAAHFEVDVVSYQPEAIEMNWWVENREGVEIQKPQTVRNQEFGISKMAPGHYLIKVQANSKLNQWSIILSHQLIIKPRWWQQPLIWLLCLMLAVLVFIYGAYYFFKRYSKKKMRQILHKNSILKLQNQLQLSRFKPHFIFNSFTPIQSLILKNKSKEALEYTEAFSKLMRKSMNMMDEEFVLLSKEIDFLTQYVLIQRYRFSNAFQFNVDISPEIPCDKTLIPTMLIQPLIENAVEHGIDHKDKSKSMINLRVHYAGKPKSLKISVFNSGNQFPQPFHPPKDHALEILSRRIKLFVMESQVGSIRFENVSEGARVIVEVPIKYLA